MTEPAETLTEDLEDLYENAPCGYLSLRPDGRIVKVNTTLATWTGFAKEQLLAKRLLDLLNIAGRIFYETHFAPLLRMQGFFNEVALDVVTADGERLPVLANAIERRAVDGKLLFTRVTIFKASQRRRYERELVDARALADARNKSLQEVHRHTQESLSAERKIAELREQFIAVLGHDLRNPLAGISSAVRLLQHETLTPRGQKVLTLVDGTVFRMAGLIDNIMDFARGRLGGGIEIDRSRAVPMAPVLDQVVDELRVSHPDRIIETDFRLSVPVGCDPSRISQLLSNLVGNALTYGAKGSPVVARASSGAGVFEISVSNAGNPIAPEAMERLFTPFSRGGVRTSQHGLGLGLYITAEVARAHGGQVDVSSTPEETRFTFRMPLAHGT